MACEDKDSLFLSSGYFAFYVYPHYNSFYVIFAFEVKKQTKMMVMYENRLRRMMSEKYIPL